MFSTVLNHLERDAARYFGVPAVRFVPAARYDRPFSHVLRVGVYSTDRDSAPLSYLFVKVFKPKVIDGDPDAIRRRVVHEFETTRAVSILMSEQAGLGAVPAVTCYPDHLAIVTAEVTGPTLLEYVQSHVGWLARPGAIDAAAARLRGVGHWLRVFQSPGHDQARVSVGSLAEYLDVRLRRLAADPRVPLGTADRDRILPHVERLGALVDEADLTEVPIHADLSLGNVLVHGDRIVVLDFAMARRGTNLHDLTRLFLQLELIRMKPHVRAAAVTRLQEALLSGFRPSLTPAHSMFRLLLLVHRVNHFGTVCLAEAPFPASLQNRLVRRWHWRAISAELNTPTAGTA